MKNNYLLLKKKHEERINNFKMIFAFSEEQLSDGIKELKTTRENLISVFGGGFIRKEDKDDYKKMFEDISQEETDLFKNEKDLYDAFYYELANHEYSYTHDETDTLQSLNFENYDDLNEFQKKVFEKAKNKYLNSQEW